MNPDLILIRIMSVYKDVTLICWFEISLNQVSYFVLQNKGDRGAT